MDEGSKTISQVLNSTKSEFEQTDTNSHSPVRALAANSISLPDSAL